MLKTILITATVVTANLSYARTDLLEYVMATKSSLDTRLAECGTERYDADDPRLPRRQIPAHYAYANPDQNSLIGYYYRASMAGEQEFKWKWPNGGAVAWISLAGDEAVSFGTPFAGTVARINRFFDPSGERFNFWCGSNRVSNLVFEDCVEERFAVPFLNAFCL